VAETPSKKGRVRRVRKKTTPTLVDTSTNIAADQDTQDTHQANATASEESAVVPAAMAQALTANLIEDVIEDVADATTTPAHAPDVSPAPINRREFAAARARRMRLTSAKDWLAQGKLNSGKQRLFELMASAPSSPEAAEAETLLLELAARYEASGKSRLALQLYDELARYD
jgi:hypothetical protein